MGVKVSKLLRRKYLVSEGVQTDLSIQSDFSIQSCTEVLDSKSFTTPTREVQHISDPRSVTRGIIRTPIMYNASDEIKDSSPVEVLVKRPPYLETNLDEVLCYCGTPDELAESAHTSCMSAYMHHADTAPSLSSSADNLLHHHSSLTMNCQGSSSDIVCEAQNSFKDEGKLQKVVCEIEILNEISEMEERICRGNNPLVSLGSSEKIYKIDMGDDVTDDSIDVEHTSEPVDSSIDTDLIRNGLVPIDSSETVQQMCQKILDELLESTDEIYVDEILTGDGTSIDREVEEMVESIKEVYTDRCHKEIISYNNENCLTPLSSKVKRHIDNKAVMEDNFNSQKRFSVRKPLGEVNENILPAVGPQSSKKVNVEIDSSQLKVMLPLLSPKSAATLPKPHRSTWDSENTLII